MDFRLTGEVGEKKAGKRENHPKMAQKKGFLAIFPVFSHFSVHLPGEAAIHFSAISPDFGPKTRKQSVAGQRDRKVSVLFSSRQSDLRNFINYTYTSVIFWNYFWGELI